MRTIRLTVELTYDNDVMHNDDSESEAWFCHQLLDSVDGLILHSNDLGDSLGTVKVLSITVPE
jgi:hypothetical protein